MKSKSPNTFILLVLICIMTISVLFLSSCNSSSNSYRVAPVNTRLPNREYRVAPTKTYSDKELLDMYYTLAPIMEENIQKYVN